MKKETLELLGAALTKKRRSQVYYIKYMKERRAEVHITKPRTWKAWRASQYK